MRFIADDGSILDPATLEKGESIPGGKAAGKTPSEFDPEQLAMGIKVEMEHTGDKDKAREIAMDHLAEFPDYYTRLDRMEAEAEREHADKSMQPQGAELGGERLCKGCGKMHKGLGAYCAKCMETKPSLMKGDEPQEKTGPGKLLTYKDLEEHKAAREGQAVKSLSTDGLAELDDFLSKAVTPVGGKTPAGYTVKMVGGKRQYIKEGQAPAKPKVGKPPHEQRLTDVVAGGWAGKDENTRLAARTWAKGVMAALKAGKTVPKDVAVDLVELSAAGYWHPKEDERPWVAQMTKEMGTKTMATLEVPKWKDPYPDTPVQPMEAPGSGVPSEGWVHQEQSYSDPSAAHEFAMGLKSKGLVESVRIEPSGGKHVVKWMARGEPAPARPMKPSPEETKAKNLEAFAAQDEHNKAYQASVDDMDAMVDELEKLGHHNVANMRGFMVRVPGSKFYREPPKRPGRVVDRPPSPQDRELAFYDMQTQLGIRRRKMEKIEDSKRLMAQQAKKYAEYFKAAVGSEDLGQQKKNYSNAAVHARNAATAAAAAEDVEGVKHWTKQAESAETQLKMLGREKAGGWDVPFGSSTSSYEAIKAHPGREPRTEAQKKNLLDYARQLGDYSDKLYQGKLAMRSVQDPIDAEIHRIANIALTHVAMGAPVGATFDNAVQEAKAAAKAFNAKQAARREARGGRKDWRGGPEGYHSEEQAQQRMDHFRQMATTYAGQESPQGKAQPEPAKEPPRAKQKAAPARGAQRALEQRGQQSMFGEAKSSGKKQRALDRQGQLSLFRSLLAAGDLEGYLSKAIEVSEALGEPLEKFMGMSQVGARGGRIIGKTSTGKLIYEKHNLAEKPGGFSGWKPDEHAQAAAAHRHYAHHATQAGQKEAAERHGAAAQAHGTAASFHGGKDREGWKAPTAHQAKDFEPWQHRAAGAKHKRESEGHRKAYEDNLTAQQAAGKKPEVGKWSKHYRSWDESKGLAEQHERHAARKEGKGSQVAPERGVVERWKDWSKSFDPSGQGAAQEEDTMVKSLEEFLAKAEKEEEEEREKEGREGDEQENGRQAAKNGEDEDEPENGKAGMKKSDMPTGGPKQQLGSRGPADGLDLTGKPAGQDSSKVQGSEAGAPGVKTDKLSDDDVDPDKFPGKDKPLGKALTQEHLAAIRRSQALRPPADVRPGLARPMSLPAGITLEKAQTFTMAQGAVVVTNQADLECEALMKAHGGAWRGDVLGFDPAAAPVHRGRVCSCGEVYKSYLTACPNCGVGAVQNRILPLEIGGPILEKAEGFGPILRPKSEPEDVFIPGGSIEKPSK